MDTPRRGQRGLSPSLPTAGVLIWQAHSRPSGSKAESAFWRCVGMGLVAVPVVLGLAGGLAALRAAIQ